MEVEKQLNLISCLQPKNYKTMNHLSDVFFLSLASTQETIFVFTIHKRRETSVFRPSNYFFSSSICFYTTKLANTKKIPQHPHKYEQKNTRPSSQKLYTKTERERKRERERERERDVDEKGDTSEILHQSKTTTQERNPTANSDVALSVFSFGLFSHTPTKNLNFFFIAFSF